MRMCSVNYGPIAPRTTGSGVGSIITAFYLLFRWVPQAGRRRRAFYVWPRNLSCFLLFCVFTLGAESCIDPDFDSFVWKSYIPCNEEMWFFFKVKYCCFNVFRGYKTCLLYTNLSSLHNLSSLLGHYRECAWECFWLAFHFCLPHFFNWESR